MLVSKIFVLQSIHLYGISFDMNLRSLSDAALQLNTQKLVKNEREMTLEVLRHLREVERRSLFAKLSYSS